MRSFTSVLPRNQLSIMHVQFLETYLPSALKSSKHFLKVVCRPTSQRPQMDVYYCSVPWPFPTIHPLLLCHLRARGNSCLPLVALCGNRLKLHTIDSLRWPNVSVCSPAGLRYMCRKARVRAGDSNRLFTGCFLPASVRPQKSLRG